MNFIMIGVGYVAPRHAKAIKDVGGNLVAFTDPNDSVGWMDQYFPGAKYFSEFPRFDRYVDLFQQGDDEIDYCVILTPNYLHDPYSRWAMKNGMDVICEKPLVLYIRNVRQLVEMEKKTGRRVYPVLQLRNHPQAIAMKEACSGKRHTKMSVTYHTPRGSWYDFSWKADPSKSGGIATNIGIHLFDLAAWCLGKMVDVPNVREYSSNRFISGNIWFERGSLDFTLSTIGCGEPKREFSIDSVGSFQFDSGFTDLHTDVYRHILDGTGCRTDDAAESIRIVEALRYGVANGRTAMVA
jgi:UDP-N-acetyl-2-amino-2-deoxyglucuronate dehydrogenase